jgi:hypothetical protein
VGWLLAWLVGGHLLLKDFGPYERIFMNICVVITFSMAMPLRDFKQCRIILNICALYNRCHESDAVKRFWA